MKYLSVFLLIALFTSFQVCSQVETEQFTLVKEIKHLPVINQGSTGTCWSFATTSFLESEIIRKGLPETDLSEMFFVRNAYENKTKQYLYYHGNNNFGQGGQAHDVLNVLREKGMVIYDDFPGKMVDGRYRHSDLVSDLNKEVSKINKSKNDFDASELKPIQNILKKHLGEVENKAKPAKLRDKLKINPNDYVELTSFTHHPFYQPFVLEVPDNWAHALYYNLPINDLVKVMYFALENGYTISWDGDTSEKTFQHKYGKADVPEKQIGKIDQKLRQKTFMNRETTDDHLMHLVGLSTDENGRNCFYTKNSWGTESNSMGGYLHMTEDYIRLKTVAILVHKDAIPKKIKSKLNL